MSRITHHDPKMKCLVLIFYVWLSLRLNSSTDAKPGVSCYAYATAVLLTWLPTFSPQVSHRVHINDYRCSCVHVLVADVYVRVHTRVRMTIAIRFLSTEPLLGSRIVVSSCLTRLHSRHTQGCLCIAPLTLKDDRCSPWF